MIPIHGVPVHYNGITCDNSHIKGFFTQGWTLYDLSSMQMTYEAFIAIMNKYKLSRYLCHSEHPPNRDRKTKVLAVSAKRTMYLISQPI